MATATDGALRIILLGKTGSGKSSFANSLTGTTHFKIGRGMKSETVDCNWFHFDTRGQTYEVVDTPGLCDTHVHPDVIYREVGKSVAVASPGPHIILLALRCDRRFTDEEYLAYTKLKELFSDEMTKYLIVVFNGMDELGETIAEQRAALNDEISRMPGNLQNVLKDASKRYIGMNNKADLATKGKLVGEVVTLMRKTVETNGGIGKFYTTRLIFDINSMLEGLVLAKSRQEGLSKFEAEKAVKKALVEDEEAEALRELNLLLRRFQQHKMFLEVCSQQ